MATRRLEIIIESDSSDMQADFKRAEGAISKITGAFGGMLVTAGGVLISDAVGGMARKIGDLNDAVVGLGRSMVTSNAQFETYGQQFDVLLNNATLAEERIKELERFGRTTPFDLPGVVEADRILQGFGLHAADTQARFGVSGTEIRRIAGDMASGVGISFQEASTLLGRFSAGATGEAISRMQELGITTREELRAMGVEFDKSGALVSPLNEAMAVVLQIMQEKFGGMMEAQSSTFNGMLSNLHDWADSTIRITGQPLFEFAKEQLADLMAFLDSSEMEQAITGFRDLFVTSIDFIRDAIAGLGAGDAIHNFVDGFANATERINSYLMRLRDQMQGVGVIDVLAETGAEIESINDKTAESLDRLANAHERTIEKLNAQVQSAGDDMGTALNEIAADYGEKAASISQKAADAIDAINRQLADRQIAYEERLQDKRISLQERLVDLERSFADKRRSINESISDKIYDLEEKRQVAQENLEDKITNLTEKAAEKRADIMAKITGETTEDEKDELMTKLTEEEAATQKQIDKLNQEYERDQQRQEKRHDRAVTRLKERLAREEEEYNFQVNRARERAAREEERMQAQHDRAVQSLQERIGREETARNEAMAKLTAERDKEIAEVRAKHETAVELLNQRIAAENASYAEQQEQIKAAAAQEIADMQRQAAERIAAINEGVTPLGELLTQKAQEYASRFWGWVTGEKVENGVLVSTPGVIDRVVTGLNTAITEKWPVIQDGLTTWKDHFYDWVTEPGGALDRTGDVLDTIADRTNEWATGPGAEKLNETGKLIGEALADGMIILFSDVEKHNEMMLEFKTQLALSAIRLGKSFNDIGENIAGGIIEGFIRGITEGHIGPALQDGLVDGAKKYLRIDSPSALFRDEVGLNVAAGIAEGIMAGAGGIQGAMAGALSAGGGTVQPMGSMTTTTASTTMINLGGITIQGSMTQADAERAGAAIGRGLADELAARGITP